MSRTDIEAWESVNCLEGNAREERIELIAWLRRRGFAVEQIRSSITPTLIASNRVLGDDGEYVSARELCERTGFDLNVLEALQRAMGLPRIDDPDAAVLLRADAEAAARAKAFIDLGIDERQVVTIVRLLAEGLGHAAEVMRVSALTATLRPGATEIELAQAAEKLAKQTLPYLGPMIEDLLLLRLRHGFETEAVNAAERAAGTLPGARDVAVAFADIVGFTELGEALPAEELESVASRLGDLARGVVEEPVRLVKMIGDAVMFVCPAPVTLLKAVLELIDAAAVDDFPRLRVGMAFGAAVNRNGDWYGSPVNVASRITGIARPGAVLVTEPARQAIGDFAGITWAFAGARRLRGVRDEVRLFRAQRQHISEPQEI